MLRLYTIPLCFLFFFIFFKDKVFAQTSDDTIIVKAFVFDDFKSFYRGKVKFPPISEKFRKVIMKYKLKCPDGNRCGEWDYLSYLYLYRPTGTKDTVAIKGPNFRVNGEEKDSLYYITEKAYSYKYNSKTGMVDSTEKASIRVIFFADPQNPLKPTDTLDVWTPYYRYTFDTNGNKSDSLLIGDIHKIFKKINEIITYPDHKDRYELCRYITPYGNQISPDWKFEWEVDVSDYRPLLVDSVELDGSSLYYGWIPGGWAEHLELTFEFIKGTPPRDVKDVYI